MTWRRSEWVSILTTIATVVFWIWFVAVKATKWDEASMALEVMTPKVEDHGKQLAVISSKLDDMSEDLRWLRRHANK